MDKAARFEDYPLYWLGESFEGHDIEFVVGLAGESSGVGLTYGTCDISGFESSCASPIQLQISPLCSNLISVTRSQVWRTRKIRGARGNRGQRPGALQPPDTDKGVSRRGDRLGHGT